MFVKVRPLLGSMQKDVPTNLEWCWKPVLVLLCVVGVDLRDPTGFLSSRSFYSLLCLALTLFSHGLNCYFTTQFIFMVPGQYPNLKATHTLIWSVIINDTDNALHSVGIHLALLLMARLNWKGLWRAFQQVERRFDRELHASLRRTSIAAVIAIVLIVKLAILFQYERIVFLFVVNRSYTF